MTAAWWRKSRGSRLGRGKDPARAFAVSLAAPGGTLHGAVAAYARGHRLSTEEAAAFDEDVRRRVAENDFQQLRELYGTASPLLALLIIVQRCATAYCEDLWARWREDAAAAGHAELARTLERLVYVEALSGDEALEAVTAGAGEAERAVARRLWEARPWRGAARPVLDLKWERLDSGAAVASRAPTDLERHLSAAIHTLAPDDQLLLHQRFAAGLPVEPAGRPPASDDLAQRVRTILAQLCGELERSGVEVPDLEAALADPRPGYRDKTTKPREEGEIGSPRPSK